MRLLLLQIAKPAVPSFATWKLLAKRVITSPGIIQLFAAKHSSIPWGFAYEMRNALSHGYFNVDFTIVWQTVQHDLPNLRAQVTDLV